MFAISLFNRSNHKSIFPRYVEISEDTESIIRRLEGLCGQHEVASKLVTLAESGNYSDPKVSYLMTKLLIAQAADVNQDVLFFPKKATGKK